MTRGGGMHWSLRCATVVLACVLAVGCSQRRRAGARAGGWRRGARRCGGGFRWAGARSAGRRGRLASDAAVLDRCHGAQGRRHGAGRQQEADADVLRSHFPGLRRAVVGREALPAVGAHPLDSGGRHSSGQPEAGGRDPGRPTPARRWRSMESITTSPPSTAATCRLPACPPGRLRRCRRTPARRCSPTP